MKHKIVTQHPSKHKRKTWETRERERDSEGKLEERAPCAERRICARYKRGVSDNDTHARMSLYPLCRHTHTHNKERNGKRAAVTTV